MPWLARGHHEGPRHRSLDSCHILRECGDGRDDGDLEARVGFGLLQEKESEWKAEREVLKYEHMKALDENRAYYELQVSEGIAPGARMLPIPLSV